MLSHEDMYERPLVDCLAEDVSCALETQKLEVDGLKPSMNVACEKFEVGVGKISNRNLNRNFGK